jgi:hypothetical protein
MKEAQLLVRWSHSVNKIPWCLLKPWRNLTHIQVFSMGVFNRVWGKLQFAEMKSFWSPSIRISKIVIPPLSRTSKPLHKFYQEWRLPIRRWLLEVVYYWRWQNARLPPIKNHKRVLRTSQIKEYWNNSKKNKLYWKNSYQSKVLF